MKLRILPLAFASAGIAFALPEGLTTGIPAFLDTDGDGVISEAERQAFVESRRQAPQGGAAAWDTNGDGVVDAEEREAAIAALRARADERRSDLFNDAAGDDGVLSLEEFAGLPAVQRVPQETVERLFALMDLDDDGEVTMEEFLNSVRGGGLLRPDTPPTPPNRPDTPPGDGEDDDEETEEEEEP